MTRTKKYYFEIDKSSGKFVVIFSDCKKRAIEKLKREYQQAKDYFIYKGFTHIEK